MAKQFSVVYPSQPWRNRTFTVRGICEFDVLNPCWDDRPTDVPGQHWGGPEFKACPACNRAAMLAEQIAEDHAREERAAHGQFGVGA